MKIAIDEVGLDAGFGNVKTVRLVEVEASNVAKAYGVVLDWVSVNRPDLSMASMSSPHGYHAYQV